MVAEFLVVEAAGTVVIVKLDGLGLGVEVGLGVAVGDGDGKTSPVTEASALAALILPHPYCSLQPSVPRWSALLFIISVTWLGDKLGWIAKIKAAKAET